MPESSERPPLPGRELYAKAHPEQHFAGSADWLEDAIFGTLDGVITALALVVAVSVVLTQPAHIIFLTVMAAAIAGTLSMFVGAFLASRSRATLIRRERAREEWEVDHLPEVERAEVREIYEKRGFSEEEVAILVRGVTSTKERWVDMMMRDELGLDPDAPPEPFRHAAIIGLSYLAGGAIPALPFLLGTSATATVFGHAVGLDVFASLGLGAAILAGVGISEATFSGAGKIRSAVEILSLGFATAIAVFLITAVLTPVVAP